MRAKLAKVVCKSEKSGLDLFAVEREVFDVIGGGAVLANVPEKDLIACDPVRTEDGTEEATARADEWGADFDLVGAGRFSANGQAERRRGDLREGVTNQGVL